MDAIHVMRHFLPPRAQLIESKMADLDGDGEKEIIGAYNWQNGIYILVLKKDAGRWREAGHIKGRFMPVRLYAASIKTVSGVKWGYIDDKGHFIIPPQYDYAEPFQKNDLAVISMKDLTGLINRSGEYVVKPIYRSIDAFSEGRAAVNDKQGYSVMDEQGKILTSKRYPYIGTYHEGRAVFQNDAYQYGYLDRQGKEVIPAQYASASDFKDKKAVVNIKEGELALIGPNGERLQTYPYAFVGQIGDGLLPFQPAADGKFGYIDQQGKVIIRPTFTNAQPFQDERAVVITNDQYGLINKQGNFVIQPKYDDIQLLGEGRVKVGKAKDSQKPYMGFKYAMVNTDGHFLTDFIYGDVTTFTDGLASANHDAYTFFINRRGKIVKSLPVIRGAGSLSFEGDLIQAVVDQRTFYYTREGKLVWRQNTMIPLSNAYLVREVKYKPNKDYYVYYPQIEGMENKTAQARVNQQLKELSQVKPIDKNVQLDYSYTGDFSVAFFKKQLLVLQLTGYNYPFGAAHGMPSQIYVHVDLATGKIYELKDLFKPNSNYVPVLSQIIGKQIETNPEYYVFPDSYKGIEPDQPFYVKEHELNIYFHPYDIAPYAAGFPTFTIPFSEIMDIVDVTGEFWKSFH